VPGGRTDHGRLTVAIVNRVPRGFLALLDAKTGGNTPSVLSGGLQPTLEMLELYTADIPMEVVQTTVAASTAAVGSSLADVTVPAGEQWLVYGGSAESRYSASAVSTRVSFSFRPASSLSNVVALQNDTQGNLSGGVANQVQLAPWNPNRPWMVRSGSTFSTRIWTGAYGAGNATYVTSVMFRRLKF